jgi:hypothetical protein
MGTRAGLLESAGHVFGKSTRKESCYDNLHISRNAWDTNLVKVRVDATFACGLREADPEHRQTPSISQSIGRPVEVALSQSYLSARKEDYQSRFLFSGATLHRFLIRIGRSAYCALRTTHTDPPLGTPSTIALWRLGPTMAKYLYGRCLKGFLSIRNLRKSKMSAP